MPTRKSGLASICLAFLAIAMLAVPSWGEELRIGAGAAPTENVLKPIKEAFEKASGLQLMIISSGPKNALQDLDKGSLDAAAAGLSLEDWLKLMKKEGVELADPTALKPVTIGKDKIVVLLHKGNPVSTLSKEQLKGLFTGQIANWKEVGGNDQPVLVVIGKLIPGTNTMFSQKVMDGAEMTKEVLEATTAEDVRSNVAANPEAIGIGPMAVINDSVKSPQTPEVGRPIILLTKGAPSAKVQKLIDFILGEGQKYIRQ